MLNTRNSDRITDDSRAFSETPNRISLRELMDRISRAIADHVPKQQWVQAEISQLKAANGGHWWLELAEHDDQANLAARARAVMWKPQAASLLERFKSATGGTLQAGLKVLVLVDTNFHPAYGLSLVVRNIDPSYTWRSVRISS